MAPGRRRGRRLRAALLAAALAPARAAVFDVQRWTYNATLWWSEHFLKHPLRGPNLAELASQLTHLAYGVFDAAKAACLGQGEVCTEVGECDVARLAWLLRELHEVYVFNVQGVVAQLAQQSGRPDGAASGPPEEQGAVLSVAAALLGETAALEGLGGCGELAGAADNPDLGPCRILIEEALRCSHLLSDIARARMAELHAAQIRELGLLTGGPAEEPIPRAPPATFDASVGLSRAEVLVSLLSELRASAPADATGVPFPRLRAAEVGVDDGRTSEALLTRLPDLHLLLIDPYEFAGESFFEREEAHSFDQATSIMNAVWERMAPFRNQSVLICQRSLDAATWVAPGSLDLVFIDGDHSYDAVRQDLRAWRGKVRPGGVLAGHDYSLFRPGVPRAVHEFAAELGVGLVLGAEHMWWLRL